MMVDMVDKQAQETRETGGAGRTMNLRVASGDLAASGHDTLHPNARPRLCIARFVRHFGVHARTESEL